ncbi:hypothetical protein SeLEV6574_g04651 [Synchytrium endobioticum]|nr:hypothetical protein SeLEV6574_g04651 [Synchytrium endobioticum]
MAIFASSGHAQKQYTPGQLIAKLEQGNHDLRGYVRFTKQANAVAITAKLNTGVSKQTLLPLSWHIHSSGVTGTNCSTAGGHLNLLNVPETSVCAKDPAQFAKTCVTGLLSSKFGTFAKADTIKGVDSTFTLEDIIGKAVVFHIADEAKTRVACANIVQDDNVVDTAAGTDAKLDSNGKDTTVSKVGVKGAAPPLESPKAKSGRAPNAKSSAKPIA